MPSKLTTEQNTEASRDAQIREWIMKYRASFANHWETTWRTAHAIASVDPIARRSKARRALCDMADDGLNQDTMSKAVNAIVALIRLNDGKELPDSLLAKLYELSPSDVGNHAARLTDKWLKTKAKSLVGIWKNPAKGFVNPPKSRTPNGPKDETPNTWEECAEPFVMFLLHKVDNNDERELAIKNFMTYVVNRVSKAPVSV